MVGSSRGESERNLTKVKKATAEPPPGARIEGEQRSQAKHDYEGNHGHEEITNASNLLLHLGTANTTAKSTSQHLARDHLPSERPATQCVWPVDCRKRPASFADSTPVKVTSASNEHHPSEIPEHAGGVPSPMGSRASFFVEKTNILKK